MCDLMEISKCHRSNKILNHFYDIFFLSKKIIPNLLNVHKDFQYILNHNHIKKFYQGSVTEEYKRITSCSIHFLLNNETPGHQEF